MIDNDTLSPKEFYLLAFSNYPHSELALFLIVLVIYLLILKGNLVIITCVCMASSLQTPMYFFLCNLSIQDIIYVSSIFPKLLSITITHDNRISFQACFTQMFLFAACIDTEFLLLTSMAYDRYVAICIPLQYHLIMNKHIYICLAAASWLISSVNSYIFTFLISKLSFCMRVNLNHFFCDLKTILKLSCTETSTMNNVIFIEIVLLGIVPFFLILTSYIFIISAILNIQTLQGKLRAFSNCSSHLIIVSVFCCTVLSLYIKPASDDSEEIDKLLSLLYAIMVPVLNPLVYTLRNKEFMKAIKDVIVRKTLM